MNTKLVRVASTDAQAGLPTVRRKTALGRFRFLRGGVLPSSTVVAHSEAVPPVQKSMERFFERDVR